MSWESWIDRELGLATGYDELLEVVSERFGLHRRNREPAVVDRRQYVAQWYRRNQWKFNRYKTLNRASKQLGLRNHCGIIYLDNHREPSKNFEKNTELVAKFLKNY